MSKSIKYTTKDYQKTILEKYQIVITEENYKKCILKEMDGKESLKGYFNEYMEKNNAELDLEWGCLMYLFIKSAEKKDVTSVEEFYKKLKSYPENYFIEYTLGDINLMYYGNIFESKDRFKKVLELKEDDSNCYYALGFIYNLLGVFHKSLECFNKAVYYSENSENPKELKLKSLHNVAVYYITVENDYDRAEKILNDILEEDPNYDRALATLRALKGDA